MWIKERDALTRPLVLSSSTAPTTFGDKDILGILDDSEGKLQAEGILTGFKTQKAVFQYPYVRAIYGRSLSNC